MSEHSKKRIRMQGGNSIWLSGKQKSQINKIIAFVKVACIKKGFVTFQGISEGTGISRFTVRRHVLVAAHIENPKLRYETGKIITGSGVRVYQKVTFIK